MKKEVVVTLILLSLVMPWFKGTAHSKGLIKPNKAGEASFCVVSSAGCAHGDACPVHGKAKRAKQARHDNYTTSKADKNKGHCNHYISCEGSDEPAELPGAFSVKPYLPPSIALRVFFAESRFLPAHGFNLWVDPALSLPERPPAAA